MGETLQQAFSSRSDSLHSNNSQHSQHSAAEDSPQSER